MLLYLLTYSNSQCDSCDQWQVTVGSWGISRANALAWMAPPNQATGANSCTKHVWDLRFRICFAWTKFSHLFASSMAMVDDPMLSFLPPCQGPSSASGWQRLYPHDIERKATTCHNHVHREWTQPGSCFLCRVTVHLEAQTRFSALCQSPASKAFEVFPSAASKAGRRVEGTAYGSKMVRNCVHGATLVVYNGMVLQIDRQILSWNIVHDPSYGLINRALLTLNTWRWDRAT